MGIWGLTERSPPHTAAVTPESLRSCLGRGGIGTPRGGLGAHGEVPPPHSGGYTRVPPVLPGPRRDRDAPLGFWGRTERSLPHTAAVTPESLRSCLGRGGIGMPRGGFGGARRGASPTQRRLHPSPSGPACAAEGYGRPVGVWGARRGPSPTQRRLHPSPSGPAWAAEG